MLRIGDDSPARSNEAAKGSHALQWLRPNAALLDTLALVGALVLAGACVYRRVWRPDWTGGEALEALWPFYVAGAVSVASRWLVKDSKYREDA